MPGPLRPWSLLLAAAVFFAGCSGNGGGPAIGKESGSGYAVSGRVVDDQQLPVLNASLELHIRKDNALVSRVNASDAGEFSFGKVQLGLYIIQVTAPGYELFIRNIDVIEGREKQMRDLKFTLAGIPIPKAYPETLQRTLNVQAGFAYQINGDYNQGCIKEGVTCNAHVSPPPNARFDAKDPKSTPWAGAVFEEYWTSTSPICAKAVQVDIYNPDALSTETPNLTNPHYWTNYPSAKWKISSPIRIVIPRNDTADRESLDHPWRTELYGGKLLARGNWTVRNFPPGKGLTNLAVDLNCFTDQKFDLYWTNFYLAPPPLDFTARPT